MEKALSTWAMENKERLKFVSLEVALIDEKGVEFKGQGGQRFQLSVPAALFNAADYGDACDFFFAYNLGKQEESSEEFDKKLKLLNERIQNVGINLGSKALKVVMNNIISIFAEGREGEIKTLENLDKKMDKLVHSSGANRGVLKAIMTEFKNLSCSGTDFARGIAVEMPDESDICKWHVKMDMSLFKESEGLYQDLQKYASQVRENEKEDFSSILLEVSFSNDYPFSPPFVRILSPKFKDDTGHVTVGGAICTEMLTPSGWLPSFSMENVLVLIQHVLLAGEGRLEMEASLSDARRDYTAEEARSAFLRFARQHGWIN